MQGIIKRTILVFGLMTNSEIVSEDSLLIDDLEIDCISLPSIIVALEEEFNIRIPIRLVSKVTTVKDVAEEIHKLLTK